MTVGNELLPGVFLTNETATSYIVYDLLNAIFVVCHCIYFSLIVINETKVSKKIGNNSEFLNIEIVFSHTPGL